MKNGQWHRSYREWFETGGLAIETQYKEGKEDGVHRDYYKNGKIRMEIEMQDGKKNGRITLWNDQGLKQWIKVYLDDIYIRSESVYEQNSTK
jgi:antitoxin component YwqK of YwqJK toxin-antitoxin module